MPYVKDSEPFPPFPEQWEPGDTCGLCGRPIKSADDAAGYVIQEQSVYDGEGAFMERYIPCRQCPAPRPRTRWGRPTP